MPGLDAAPLAVGCLEWARGVTFVAVLAEVDTTMVNVALRTYVL
jgi:hypothetical protein